MSKESKVKCSEEGCNHPSISQVGLCNFHYAKIQWGIEWAALVHPDHPEAKQHKQEKANV